MFRRHDRGAVTVEFALIVPVFLLLILAIVEFGVRYQRHAEFSNEAFIAARNMSINNSTAQASAAASAAGMPGTASISISGSCPPGSNGTVTVTITGTEDSPTKAFGATFTASGKGVARCET